MKICCTIILALLLCRQCDAQHTPADSSDVSVPKTVHGTDIPLCCGLDDPHYEYSGLARWKDKVLLIPQYPDRWENSLFAADSSDIDKTIAGAPGSGVRYSRIKIKNLDAIRGQMNGTYQGFEGAVVVDNTIFFTLEFSESTCYLLKGYIRTAATGTEIELQKPYPVQKLQHAYVNAGYESIGYLPGSKTLTVIFEKNSDTMQPSVLLVDTSFNKAPVPASFTSPMFFRLTDIAASGPGRFIGINHFYNDYRGRKKEYDYYVGDGNVGKAALQMAGAAPAEKNYTGIVQLVQAGGHITWQTEKFISFGEENWEGILPFKNGFLMVVDEYPKDSSPRMRYFEW